jgi:dihydrolipoamide dehydrogenase
MAEVAVSTITGGSDRMRYSAVPWVVYTNPEVAGVGLTEEQARERGIEVRVAKRPMRINGRYYAEHGNEPGLCKVIAAADSGVLLGVQMVGAVSSEIIYGAAAMIESELRVRDIREIIFPHPTVSEMIKDTLWDL